MLQIEFVIEYLEQLLSEDSSKINNLLKIDTLKDVLKQWRTEDLK